MEYCIHRGNVRHTELQYLTCNDVLQLIKCHGVISAEKPPSATHCFTGWSLNVLITSTTTLGWDKVRVEAEKCRPTNCNNCQRYGHHTDHLMSSTRFPRCSASHKKQDCRTSTPSCPACGGEHKFTSHTCPYSLSAGQQIQVTANIADNITATTTPANNDANSPTNSTTNTAYTADTSTKTAPLPAPPTSLSRLPPPPQTPPTFLPRLPPPLPSLPTTLPSLPLPLPT